MKDALKLHDDLFLRNAFISCVAVMTKISFLALSSLCKFVLMHAHADPLFWESH